MKTEDTLNLLEKVAEGSEGHSHARLAAAIVKNNQIISIGTNRMKTDPFQARFGKNQHAIYLHAEIHAIKNALKTMSISDLAGSDLYICRIKRPFSTAKHYIRGLAKPCEGCARAIVEFGIRRVIYSTDESHGIM